MFLIIVGLCFLFISTFFVYEKAKEAQQSGILWAFVNIFTFLCSYLVILFITAFIFGTAINKFGAVGNILRGFGELIHLIVLVATSSAGFIIILRYLNKIKN
jgi:hypothetical protein